MIKFVYFDVGGVVIKDFAKSHKWEEFQANLGLKETEFEAFSQWFDEVEGNLCLTQEFDALIPAFEERFKLKLPDGFSLLKDMVGRFEANPSIWPVIEKAQQMTRVGLLTNMYVGMFKEIERRRILPPVTWDVVIDSSIVRLKKPDPRIFVLAQKRCGVKPEEILFVENSTMHVGAAKRLGWQTFLYDSGDYEGTSKALAAYIQKL